MSHKCFVVQARLNFDDPVVGVYDGESAALKRARLILKHPDRIGKFVDAADVTGLISVCVYRCNGAKVPECILREEFPGDET